MRTHVIKDRYGLFSTVEIYDGNTRVAITTCRPGNERRTAERLKALHKHRKPPADDPADDPIDDPIDDTTQTKPLNPQGHTQ